MSSEARRPPGALRSLGSLRNKLVALSVGITALGFLVIYAFVVPQLTSSLESNRLDELTRVANGSQDTLEALVGNESVPGRTLDRRVRAIADAAGARVTVLGVQRSRSGTQQLFVVTDSREQRTAPRDDVLAQAAIQSNRAERGAGSQRGERVGEVALPLDRRGRPESVALFTRGFSDVQDTVVLIRNRLLIGTGIALLVALLGSYLVAQALSRRVRRLEEAAKSVSSGEQLKPLPVDSSDELGQLAQSFNDMQAQLSELDVARKDFVATASHELRTPLFSLGGFIELLQDEDLDEETRREFLDTASEQVERLQKLAVDLLDLSRLDAGAVALEHEAVDLSALAREVLGEFKPAVTRHGTRLELRLPSRTRALCDRQRAAQIVRILLDNALRHTPEGTHVTVSASRDDGTISLTVADAGPGLSNTDQVFERFHTGDATQGAGLGLAIARELAERMDGSLRASGSRHGASFTLELPADGPRRRG